ncbi:hypothetical protein U7230_11520 [Carboxydochorda subterranea]|uniref:Uncharacterized protein n=1 Tax=Carboxydichorda subterranea TaxID=3109565 RepID=A0ABZ1BVJ8_9FIRM|nr:hypothetical protein [Limnochorda sp. L945t]WRP16709.1 hypothetical protein U7230_11520 [Limnochorda sp. L945t]
MIPVAWWAVAQAMRPRQMATAVAAWVAACGVAATSWTSPADPARPYPFAVLWLWAAVSWLFSSYAGWWVASSLRVHETSDELPAPDGLTGLTPTLDDWLASGEVTPRQTTFGLSLAGATAGALSALLSLPWGLFAARLSGAGPWGALPPAAISVAWALATSTWWAAAKIGLDGPARAAAAWAEVGLGAAAYLWLVSRIAPPAAAPGLPAAVLPEAALVGLAVVAAGEIAVTGAIRRRMGRRDPHGR